MQEEVIMNEEIFSLIFVFLIGIILGNFVSGIVTIYRLKKAFKNNKPIFIDGNRYYLKNCAMALNRNDNL